MEEHKKLNGSKLTNIQRALTIRTKSQLSVESSNTKSLKSFGKNLDLKFALTAEKNPNTSQRIKPLKSKVFD